MTYCPALQNPHKYPTASCNPTRLANDSSPGDARTSQRANACRPLGTHPAASLGAQQAPGSGEGHSAQPARRPQGPAQTAQLSPCPIELGLDLPPHTHTSAARNGGLVPVWDGTTFPRSPHAGASAGSGRGRGRSQWLVGLGGGGGGLPSWRLPSRATRSVPSATTAPTAAPTT